MLNHSSPILNDSLPICHWFSTHSLTILDPFVVDSRRFPFVIDSQRFWSVISAPTIVDPRPIHRQFSTVLKCYFSSHRRWFSTHSSSILDNLNPFVADSQWFEPIRRRFKPIHDHSQRFEPIHHRFWPFTTKSSPSIRTIRDDLELVRFFYFIIIIILFV